MNDFERIYKAHASKEEKQVVKKISDENENVLEIIKTVDEYGEPYYKMITTINLKCCSYNINCLSEMTPKEVLYYLNNSKGYDDIGWFEEW